MLSFLNFNYPYVCEIEALNYDDPLTNKGAKLHCTNLLWEKQGYVRVDTNEPPLPPLKIHTFLDIKHLYSALIIMKLQLLTIKS
jgi:hypothetical protein